MYIGTSDSFIDLDEVKFIKVGKCYSEITFETFNHNHGFKITEKAFDKFLEENDVNFIKLVQKNDLYNNRNVFYVNCDKIGCLIDDKQSSYNIVIKFKKKYQDDTENTLYVDCELNDLEFEILKARIAKGKKFVNI